MKFQKPMCHRQLFRIISQNPEYVKTCCFHLEIAFHFSIRKWILKNSSEAYSYNLT